MKKFVQIRNTGGVQKIVGFYLVDDPVLVNGVAVALTIENFKKFYAIPDADTVNEVTEGEE